MNINFSNLQLQYKKYQNEIDFGIHKVLNESNYVMGDQVHKLEEALEEFTGANHAITCSSGTDALLLALMALDIQPGDEIITTPFTFIATAEAIALMKAKPVFVDIERETFNIDASKITLAITNKTKAIIPVSLYGLTADIGAIQTIANKHNLKTIIDGAQSFGSTYQGKTDSNLGNISITSFFPAKPLGCYGDGGAIFTNNDEYAEKIRMLRVHGQTKRYHHKYIGMGGRLDTIQAAVLLAKMPHYAQELEQRNEVAQYYTDMLSKSIKTPVVKSGYYSAWAQYTVRVKNRESIQTMLKSRGIPTAIHYPIPLHLQECFRYLDYELGDFPEAERSSNQVMSLPMNAFLNINEIEYVTSQILDIINRKAGH